MSANVGLFLHDWAKREPSRTAIVDAGRGDLECSYGAIDEQASRVAGFLRDAGLESEDRVAVFIDNGLAFVNAWFGAVYAGATTLPVPSMSTAREVAFRLRHAGCRAILCDEKHADLAGQANALAGGNTAIMPIEKAVRHPSPIESPAERSRDQVAMILYTSGTTGKAKGVCITHGSLNAHTNALVTHTLRVNEDDRLLGVIPLTHSYGIRMTLLVPFFAGAATVFVPRFSAAKSLSLCARHGVTFLPGVPTMFVAWANLDEGDAPPRLRWCLSAGAPLPEEVRVRAEKRLGATVRQGYGLTEATFSTINAPPDRAAPGSVGKPVAGVTVQIADAEGNPMPNGERGEVLVRGKNVMLGYLDDEEATRHVTRGGWLHTGDVGLLDDEGRLTVVDRDKDLILRGGHSIYPFEVEDALAAHPAVVDVAVVGKPDDYYGEEIVAVIVQRSAVSPRELDAWVREHLAPVKVPRAYAFVPELPQGASGKTLKRALRSQIAAEKLSLRPASDDGTAD
ncbi:MAG: AMP-binding protein [Myxococcota bacterium]